MRAVRTALAVILAAATLVACVPSTEELQERTETDEETTSPRPRKEQAEEQPVAETEPTSDVQELSVVNTGFGRLSFEEGAWWYAVVFTNPNPDVFFDFAEIVVEAVAADGTILDSSSDFLTILPGDSAITGSFFEVGATEIDHLDVRGPVADDAEPAPDGGLGGFTTSEIAATSDEYSTTVGGILTSTFATEQELIKIVVVATNPAGAIIGAEWTYVDRLPVDGRVRFEASFYDPLPADTSFVAFAVL